MRALISICLAFSACGCDVFVPRIGGENQPCSSQDTCRTGFVCFDGKCCTEQAYRQCGSDGSVHWFTSCDNQGQLVSRCNSECEECVDTSASEAECQAQGNWAVGSDCTACIGNWDPAWNCEECANHWEDNADDCGTCPGNWDSSQDCGVCRNQWVDEENDCSACPGNWDASQDCAVCLTGFAGDDCEKVASCTGQPDFTLCELNTNPDYWYDVCVDEECLAVGACPDASCNPPGPGFVLADSGQRKCYDDSSEMDCADCAASNHCGQDAQHGWDVTHTSDERFTRSEPEWSMPVVADNLTGLMWQGCVPNLNGANCLNSDAMTRSWGEARDYCDELNWGGCLDWRLPSRLELQSLVDYGRHGPSIDSEAFPRTESDLFWTATVDAQDDSRAWLVRFNRGVLGRELKTGGHYLRCVRQEPGR